jgi:hypothetical protein
LFAPDNRNFASLGIEVLFECISLFKQLQIMRSS